MDHRLFDAARTGDILKLEFLLQEDPLLLDRLCLSSPENPLHVSAFSGQAGVTAKILSLKPGLAMEPNHQGFSPLHIAAASGRLEVVRELLRVWKRDVCLLKDKDGSIPLHCAAQRGRIDVIKELVSTFPDSLKERTMASFETPLHVAVKNNHVEATKLLLKEIKNHNMERAIVNGENRDGNTVLHLATLGKQLQIVEMLIGEEAIVRGVDANIQNRGWLTPKDILDVVLETEGGSVSEMYRIVQIFQTADAKNAKEKRSNAKPIPHSRSPWRRLRIILDYEITNFTSEQRQTLMVVATLIATLTFTAILQPPGAFRSEESNGGSQNNTTTATLTTVMGSKNSTAGQAIMASNIVDFTLYASFNAIGFLASVTMISLLTRGFPLRNWMRLCIISLVATYLTAIFYIAPKERTLWWVVLGVSSLLVLRELFLFIKSLLEAFSIAKRRYFSP